MCLSEFVLQKFKAHLTAPSSGGSSSKQARKELNHLRTLAAECNITDLFTVGTTSVLNSIQEDFIDKNIVNPAMKASTIRNHLSSLFHLGKYFFTKEITPSFGHAEFDRLKVRKEEWFRSLNKLQKQEAVEQHARDEETMVSPEDFQKYHLSERAEEARALLNDPPEHITKNKFCWARDYLITELTFRNAPRASGICGMLVEEVTKATYMENSDNYVIKVQRMIHLAFVTWRLLHVWYNLIILKCLSCFFLRCLNIKTAQSKGLCTSVPTQRCMLRCLIIIII